VHEDNGLNYTHVRVIRGSHNGAEDYPFTGRSRGLVNIHHYTRRHISGEGGPSYPSIVLIVGSMQHIRSSPPPPQLALTPDTQ